MLKSAHWKEWIAVLLLFGTGVLVGAGGMQLYMEKTRPPFPPPQEIRGKIIERLDEELHLTQEQYDAISAILMDSFRRSWEIRRPIDKKMNAMFEEQFKKISAVLRPDQQKKFKALNERLDRRRKELHGPPPPPPPPLGN